MTLHSLAVPQQMAPLQVPLQMASVPTAAQQVEPQQMVPQEMLLGREQRTAQQPERVQAQAQAHRQSPTRRAP